ncbi:cellulose binding domain-containing protein [Streptosporangium sp. NPDC002607]
MRSRLAGALGVVVLAPVIVAILGVEAAGASTCTATYQEVNSWSYQENGSWVTDNMVEISIKNTSTSIIDEWQLNWTWPGKQKVAVSLAGRTDQSGADVTVHSNGSWNPMKPNTAVQLAFIHRGASAVPAPTVTCTPVQ